MKTIEYRTMDKKNWGEGPWLTEPDKIQWQDKETGYPCLVVRSSLGHLCGYVGVSANHPLFEKDYNQIYDIVDLNVHGGLTFSDFCHKSCDQESSICHLVDPGEEEKVWWIGFDCAHCGDYSPGMSEFSHYREEPYFHSEDYKDLAYVRKECKNLSSQLLKVQREDTIRAIDV